MKRMRLLRNFMNATGVYGVATKMAGFLANVFMFRFGV